MLGPNQATTEQEAGYSPDWPSDRNDHQAHSHRLSVYDKVRLLDVLSVTMVTIAII